MDWTGIIGNIAGGGVMGLVGSLATGWLQLKTMGVKNKHEISMLRLTIDKQTALGELKAFSKSQDSGARDVMSAPPPNASPALNWMIYGIQGLRTATRPLLTWSLVISAFYNPQMSGMAAMAVGWWFGSRPSAFFTQVDRSQVAK